MRQKVLTVALSALVASTMLFSCHNVEEPIPTPGNITDDNTVEYTISVNVPEEMRTRAASGSQGSIRESGIFEFTQRDINKLWYAMYYDGEFKSNDEINRTDNKPFSISIRVDDKTDPSKLWFFFWAGNSEDPIQINKSLVGHDSQLASINYNEKKVSVSPYYLNGYALNKADQYFFDSFAGYFQFTTNNDKSQKTASFTLKRPFAQIHVLTDDFMPSESDLYKDYPNGIRTYSGLGNEKLEKSNLLSQLQFPTTWNYETNSLEIEQVNPTFPVLMMNMLGYGDEKWKTYKTNFKDREMHYLSLFHVLAPGGIKKSEVSKLNIGITKYIPKNGSSISNCDKFISLELPEQGIQANNIYVFYDKPRSEGGTGFLEGYFDYEILVNQDGNWEESNSENMVDRL